MLGTRAPTTTFPFGRLTAHIRLCCTYKYYEHHASFLVRKHMYGSGPGRRLNIACSNAGFRISIPSLTLRKRPRKVRSQARQAEGVGTALYGRLALSARKQQHQNYKDVEAFTPTNSTQDNRVYHNF